MRRIEFLGVLLFLVVVFCQVNHLLGLGEVSQCGKQLAFSFGFNEHGQLGLNSPPFRLTPVSVDRSGELNGHEITAFAAGGSHSLVLSVTGQVFSFGNNGRGQLGDGTYTDRSSPVAVDTSGVLNGLIITAISAGGSHSLVLSANGQVFSFGHNEYGQLGNSNSSWSVSNPVAVDTSGVLNGHNITAISAGGSHSLVLSATGQVFSFGNNWAGQLGDGTTDWGVSSPVAVNTSGVLNGLTITAISAGGSHSLVLSATGQVFSFGSNGYGQLGDGSTTYRSNPVAVDRSEELDGLKITAIAAGGKHSLALSATGQVFSFGSNVDGQLGDGTTDWSVSSPVAVNSSGVLNGLEITSISAGGSHSLALSATGQVFSFGNNEYGRLGDGTTTSRYNPVAVNTSEELNGLEITAISAGGSHSLVLSVSGNGFSFGRNYVGELGNGESNYYKFSPAAVYRPGVLNGHNISSISAGGYHSLVLSDTGQVFSFGSNGAGQLGDGTTTYRYSPVAVNTSEELNGLEITSISAGGSHSLVVSVTGQVFSFGYNGAGQLGDGTTSDRYSPVAVNTSGVLNGLTITAISAGGSHSLVLSATGQVFSFGNNWAGQLGDDTTTSQSNPVAVDTSGMLNGHDITAISAGFEHSLVLSATGQVFSFGHNGAGQLGDNSTINRYSPVAVDTSGVLNGSTITYIAAGGSHSLVLSVTGQVFSFGYNEYGQLGDGTTDWGVSNPVAVNTSGVLDGLTITSISAGYEHSLVLSVTGQVFSFGSNEYGRLGDGTTSHRYSPVAVDTSRVLNGLEITSISAGGSHSLVLSVALNNITAGKVRDGSIKGEQMEIQSSTDKVSANWDAFVSILANGRTRNATTFNITTVEQGTGRVVLGPRLISFPNEQAVFSFEGPTDEALLHNKFYVTTISQTTHCYDVMKSSTGFLVDTTLPTSDSGSSNLPHSDSGSSNPNDLMLWIALTGIGGVGFLLIVLIVVIAVVGITSVVLRFRRPNPSKDIPAPPPDTSSPGTIELKTLSVPPVPLLSRVQIEYSALEIPFWELNVIERLGKGASGVVVKAIYQESNVAVKLLDVESEGVEEYLKEAITMVQLQHPRLLQFVGVVNEEGKFGIVMEFMEGGSLDKHLWRKSTNNKSNLSWSAKLGIVCDVAAGMTFIHSRGYIHRDLKSPNVLINESNRAKIGDFGLARAVEKSKNTMTTNAGSPLWMAPEVIESTAHYDNKCDVFSFGIIMWEILTEKEPYHDIPNKQSIVFNVVRDPHFRPGIPSVEQVMEMHSAEEEKRSIDTMFMVFVGLMQECWAQDPTSRPTFMEITGRLNEMSKLLCMS